jgi:hypothetical protein
MEREKEISILIDYLEKDVIRTQSYPSLLADCIIRNGKLIESYKLELEQLKKEKGL